MDNILYGIKDPDYPFFKHLNGVHVPPETDTTFIKEHTKVLMLPKVSMMV